MNKEELLKKLPQELLKTPPQPAGLYTFSMGAKDSMLRYKVLFPAVQDRDTKTRIFSYREGESEKVEIPIPADQPELVFDVSEDVEVHLELFNVDNANNRSTPSTFSFVSKDTIPPAAPGAMSILLVDEVFENEGGDSESESEEDDSEDGETDGGGEDTGGSEDTVQTDEDTDSGDEERDYKVDV